MRGINKVTLVGYLGKDPEIRVFDSGTMVANFSIATTEYYKNKSGENDEKTEWHQVAMWRGLAERAEKFLKKGSLVYLEGRLRTDVWEDKNETKHYSTKVVATSLLMLDKKPDEIKTPPKKEKAPIKEAMVEEPVTDLPF